MSRSSYYYRARAIARKNAAPRMMTARYKGLCVQCGAQIEPGQTIEWDGARRAALCERCARQDGGHGGNAASAADGLERPSTLHAAAQDGGTAGNAARAMQYYTRQELAAILLKGEIFPPDSSYTLVTEEEKAAAMELEAARRRRIEEEEAARAREEEERQAREQEEAAARAEAVELARVQQVQDEAEEENSATLEDAKGRTRHTVAVNAYAMTRNNHLIYLDARGAQQATRALWARLCNASADGGRGGARVQINGKSVNVDKGEKWRKIEAPGRLVLVNKQATADALSYVIEHDSNKETPSQARDVIARADVPALDGWSDAIWRRARCAGLVEKMEFCRGCSAWQVRYNGEKWREALTAAHAAGELKN